MEVGEDGEDVLWCGRRWGDPTCVYGEAFEVGQAMEEGCGWGCALFFLCVCAGECGEGEKGEVKERTKIVKERDSSNGVCSVRRRMVLWSILEHETMCRALSPGSCFSTVSMTGSFSSWVFCETKEVKKVQGR